jgi:hypothetical protein
MCRKALKTETGTQCHNFVSPSHLLNFYLLPATGNRSLAPDFREYPGHPFILLILV